MKNFNAIRNLVTIVLTFTLFRADAQVQKKFRDLHTHLTLKNYNRFIYDALVIDSFANHKYANWQASRVQYDSINRSLQAGPCDAHFRNFDQATIPQCITGRFDVVITSLTPIERNTVVNPKGKVKARWLAKQPSKLEKYKFNKLRTVSSYQELIAELEFLNFAIAFNNEINKDKAQIIDSIAEYDDKKLNIILSIEGGHTLFNKISNTHLHSPYSLTLAEINDMFFNIQTLKNYKNRIMFITLDHLWWNNINGQAKATYKPNWRAVALSAGALIPKLNKKMFNKWGSGLDSVLKGGKGKLTYDNRTTDSIFPNVLGYKVINMLLDTVNVWRKPIYIDLRHADVKSRLQYYRMVDSLWKHKRQHIPIIHSHMAVAGENLKVAYFTGLGGLYDRYPELRCPRRFFLGRKMVIGSRLVTGQYNRGLARDFPEEFAQYYDTALICNAHTCKNTKRNHKHDLHEDSLGWFFSWGINLYDEEIAHIYNNGGMMGLMIEERLLGAYQPKYKTGKYSEENVRKLLSDTTKFKQRYNTQEKKNDFIETAAFLRNLYYIVTHSGKIGDAAWKSVCFSSDFDGLTDPLDNCMTAEAVPEFKAYLLGGVIRDFCTVYDLDYRKFFTNGFREEQAMELFFHDNFMNFMKKHF